MLANDVIYHELRRLVDLTDKLENQVRDLTARLAALENRGSGPRSLSGSIPYKTSASSSAV